VSTLVALAGNPNTGKTSLFNRLTGSNARVGNYPGVTVERETALWKLPNETVEVVDIPGTYSLACRSGEEQVAVGALFGLQGNPRPHAVMIVVDATQLVRNLYLALQVVEAGIPAVVVVNLIDQARKEGIELRLEQLEALFLVPVVAVSAHTGEGLGELQKRVQQVLEKPRREGLKLDYGPVVEKAVAALEKKVEAASAAEARALVLWALLSVDEQDELMAVPEAVRQEVWAVRKQVEAGGEDLDGLIISTRYRFLESVALVRQVTERENSSEKLDRWALHPVVGPLLFVGVMGILFQAIFSWSDPAITAIETLFGWVGERLRVVLPEGVLADLLVDGGINGVGSVVVFLPQILLLFFLLGLLEDSGYMARVAYLVDRVMRLLGLHGRAFVPLLSGYACAVPAVMATRTLESQRDRLLTMMVVPLMSCSARLPVYSLVIAALFPEHLRSILMVGMYLFSTLMALTAAGVLGKTILKGKRIPLLLELPPYRLPRLETVIRQMWLRAKMFLTEAGTVIAGCTLVLWAMLYFPRDVEFSKDFEALKVGASEEVVHSLEAEETALRLEQSYGGRAGKLIEPLIEPLGFDWKIGIGLVGAFAAREVFVSIMGLVYGVGELGEDDAPLREKMAASTRPDGSRVYTPLTGISIMVFFALSAQCLSTLAAVKRESGSWKWAAFLFVYMTVLAWAGSFIVYQSGRLLGFA
jgi:ferrous iron transport protein B